MRDHNSKVIHDGGERVDCEDVEETQRLCANAADAIATDACPARPLLRVEHLIDSEAEACEEL